MKVIKHMPSFWYLCEDNEDFYLSVNSGYSFVGYSITFQLNEEELRQFRVKQESYISELAQDVNNVQKPYIERQRAMPLGKGDEMHDAIMTWKSQASPAK